MSGKPYVRNGSTEDDPPDNSIIDEEKMQTGIFNLPNKQPAPSSALDELASREKRDLSNGRVKKIVSWLDAKIFYDFTTSLPKYSIWVNIFMALGVWIGTGLLAAVLLLNKTAQMRVLLKSPTGEEIHTNGHTPDNSEILPTNPYLANLVIYTGPLFVGSLVATTFMALSDQRGHLRGLPGFRRHFNFFLYVSYILEALSAFTLLFAITYGSSRFLYEPAIVWLVGFFFKYLSWSQEGGWYAAYNFVWFNFIGGGAIASITYK